MPKKAGAKNDGARMQTRPVDARVHALDRCHLPSSDNHIWAASAFLKSDKTIPAVLGQPPKP